MTKRLLTMTFVLIAGCSTSGSPVGGSADSGSSDATVSRADGSAAVDGASGDSGAASDGASGDSATASDGASGDSSAASDGASGDSSAASDGASDASAAGDGSDDAASTLCCDQLRTPSACGSDGTGRHCTCVCTVGASGCNDPATATSSCPSTYTCCEKFGTDCQCYENVSPCTGDPGATVVPSCP